MSALFHACGAWYFATSQQVGSEWWRNLSLLGLSLSLIMLGLSRLPRLPLLWVEVLGIGIALMWLLNDAVQISRGTQPLASYLLLDLVVLAVLAFTWLSLRAAVMLLIPVVLLVNSVLHSFPDYFPLLLIVNMVLFLIGFMSVYGKQLSVERARAEWLHTLAFRDPLTGLASRRLAEDELAKLLTLPTWQRADVALVLLDVDYFKRVNDALGHLEGDRILRELAHLLSAEVQPDDLVSRWGGEEFLLLLHGVQPNTIWRQVDALRRKVMQTFERDHITFSAGIALLDEHTEARELLILADQRLYVAKAQGRNQAVWREDQRMARAIGMN